MVWYYNLFQHVELYVSDLILQLLNIFYKYSNNPKDEKHSYLILFGNTYKLLLHFCIDH